VGLGEESCRKAGSEASYVAGFTLKIEFELATFTVASLHVKAAKIVVLSQSCKLCKSENQ